MYRVLDILLPEEVAECRQIAAGATFVHGKITNPHNKAKQNEQLHEQAAYQRSAQARGSMPCCEARNSASSPFPAQIAPPLLTRYKPGHALWRARRRRLSEAPAWNGPQRSQLHDLPQRAGELRRRRAHIRLATRACASS